MEREQKDFNAVIAEIKKQAAAYSIRIGEGVPSVDSGGDVFKKVKVFERFDPFAD